MYLHIRCVLCLCLISYNIPTPATAEPKTKKDIETTVPDETTSTTHQLQERIQNAKLDLWKRGAFDLDEEAFLESTFLFKDYNDDEGGVGKEEEERLFMIAKHIEEYAKVVAPVKLGPVRESRRHVNGKSNESGINQDYLAEIAQKGFWNARYSKMLMDIRGGDISDNIEGADLEEKLKKLGAIHGSEFIAAIEKNKEEHKRDCEKSCEKFYCASSESSKGADNVEFHSYSMGSVPPEDFAEDFGFPLDLIKVSKDSFFPKSEAANVVTIAEEEGLSSNEYRSGKYKLGGDWLVNLPRTREWFNGHLEKTFFPLLTKLFPEIISSPEVLRAHSVSLLKYNSSHPRTDVHVDNGILAMTIAMTPMDEYSGGGTFFEHMGVDHVLPMDVGHGTFRPGSVRHGGHRVGSGTRYILGAFLLIEDRVEHVRRLKNRGADLRKKGELDAAIKHFDWALAINPKCTTCLKDWAEILQYRKEYALAEQKIRQVLELLEDKDSDALFSLGQLLSEQGKDDESIAAYTKSVNLNAEDVELCYNLGIKYGSRGDYDSEMKMYERATNIDSTFGGAWLNWGTSLAEQGKFDEAEQKFKTAIDCCPDVAPKAMLNLAIIYQSYAGKLAANGNLEAAKADIMKASENLDTAKPLLDAAQDVAKKSGIQDDSAQYISKYKPLRLQCHKLKGQILAATKDFVGCEVEFKQATENFPNEPGAWEMLARVLEIQGKAEEAKNAKNKMETLRKLNFAFGP